MAFIKSSRSAVLFEGFIFVILGILAIIAPIASTIATEIIVGWLLILGGCIQSYRSFKERENKGFYLSLISSILYIGIGIIFLLFPVLGIITLTLILIFFFLLEGIMKIILAFKVKPLYNWAWVLLSGIVSVIMGIIIWSGWPGTASWVLGLLIGINMLFLGSTLIALGYNIPKGS